MKNIITMPTYKPHTAGDIEVCRPYLVVERGSGNLHTIIIVNRYGATEDHNPVLFFDTEGFICHGSEAYLKRSYDVIRAYRPGETLTFVRGDN